MIFFFRHGKGEGGRRKGWERLASRLACWTTGPLAGRNVVVEGHERGDQAAGQTGMSTSTLFVAPCSSIEGCTTCVLSPVAATCSCGPCCALPSVKLLFDRARACPPRHPSRTRHVAPSFTPDETRAGVPRHHDAGHPQPDHGVQSPYMPREENDHTQSPNAPLFSVKVLSEVRCASRRPVTLRQ